MVTISFLEQIDLVERSRGRTNTAAALRMVRTDVYGRSGDRDPVRNVAVVLTDGGSSDFADTLEAAKELRTSGNQINYI